MGWQPGPGNAAGEDPDRGPGGPPPARDPRLAQFASAGGRDALVPSGRLALTADEVSGPGRRCPGASDDELAGLLRAWAAVESWAAAARLGVVAELIRRDGPPPHGGYHGDLPDEWSPSLRHELALALACSVQSAEATAWLAWEQQARLPGIRALLSDGTLTLPKARAVTETFRYLSDGDAAGAEALILGQLAGKTYTQVLRLAEQAALTVDPGLAARRREQAQKNDARVTAFREPSGTVGLSGRDLPPDEALAAMASVNARAQEYEDSGAFGDTRMDVLRAYGYLDLLNGVTAENRIACGQAQDEAADAAEALAWAQTRAARTTAQASDHHQPETTAEPAASTGTNGDTGTGAAARNHPDAGSEPRTPAEADPLPAPAADTPDGAYDPAGDDDADAGPRDCRRRECDSGGEDRADRDDNSGEQDDGEGEGPGDHDDDGDSGEHDDGHSGEPGGGPGSGGPRPGPGAPPTGRALQPRLPDLIIPLLTLLGLTERPGEIQGFGLLDPTLARELAAAAATSARTEVCVTVTSPEGYAIGHGCARPGRARRSAPAPAPPGDSPADVPARLNLTIPATALAGLAARSGPASLADSAGPWGLVPRGSPGPSRADPPDGYGTWTLVLPDGRQLTARLDVLPTFECDHRYETHGYHPSGRLRHLVQVRDGTCTFPPCNRHARDSDFEHALPYDKGGRTCTCNAGARSRACHRVKQSAGWNVTQPRPGWHQWQTPAGRSYVQEPKRYPA
jgi:hypothetical protein